jgi:hypothetical protein
VVLAVRGGRVGAGHAHLRAMRDDRGARGVIEGPAVGGGGAGWGSGMGIPGVTNGRAAARLCAGSDVAVRGWLRLGPRFGHIGTGPTDALGMYCALWGCVRIDRKGVLERMSLGGRGKGWCPLLERWWRWQSTES